MSVIRWYGTIVIALFGAWSSLLAQQQSYTLFARNNLDKVFPQTRPTVQELAAPLKLTMFAAQGEYEPVTFAAYSAETLTGVDVTASALTGPGGTIEAGQVQCHYIFNQWLYRTLGEGYPYNKIPRVLYTMEDFRLHRNASIQADSCAWFWVTVKVPENAASGVYEGTVRFRAAGHTDTAIPLTVEVLSFTLQPPTLNPSVFYKPPFWLYSGDHTEFWNMVDTELTDIREHGFSASVNPLANNILMQVNDYSADSAMVNFINMRTFMQKFVEHGLTAPVTFYDLWQSAAYRIAVNNVFDPKPEWFSARFDRLFGHVLNQCKAEWEAHPEWPELIAEVWDEPSNHNKIDYYDAIDESDTEEARQMLSRVRNGGFKGATHLANNDNSRYLVAWLEIGLVNSRHIGSETAALLRNRADRSLWMYNAAKHYLARTFHGSFERGTLGFHMWVIPEVEATVEFMYNSINTSADMPADAVWQWERPERAYLTFSLPTADGTRRSMVEWEWMREGIDDQRYMATLEYMIAEAGLRGIDTKTAGSVVEQIRTSVPATNWVDIYKPEPSGGLEAMESAFGDLEYYQETRRLAADAIAALREDIITGVDDHASALPDSPVLHPNYPNPFNPETTIRISVPRTMRCRVTVYDVLGRTVRHLYEAPADPGMLTLRWDGRSDYGSAMPSGIYILRVSASSIQLHQKLLLLR